MKSTIRPIKVGDRVRFTLATVWVEGTVVEDRGHIAKDGMQLVRVRVAYDPDHEMDFEMPADELEIVGASTRGDHG
ncbi:MAG: hypothetical protein WD069_11970 [Planctomycetales bacterium]